MFLAIAIYIGFSIIGGICSLLLPIETVDKGLEEISNDLKALESKKISEGEVT